MTKRRAGKTSRAGIDPERAYYRQCPDCLGMGFLYLEVRRMPVGPSGVGYFYTRNLRITPCSMCCGVGKRPAVLVDVERSAVVAMHASNGIPAVWE